MITKYSGSISVPPTAPGGRPADLAISPARSHAERGALLDGVPSLDHATVLAQATAWLATRDPSERASRELIAELTFAL